MFGLQRMWCLESVCQPFNVALGPVRHPVFRGNEGGSMSWSQANSLDCYLVSAKVIMCSLGAVQAYGLFENVLKND